MQKLSAKKKFKKFNNYIFLFQFFKNLLELL